MIIPTAHKMWR